MSTEDPQLEISGYPVERVRVGQHTLGHVVINENVSVVFRMADGLPGAPDPDCLSCKVNAISRCAEAVCPDVKEHEGPEASCREELDACVEIACRRSCGKPDSDGFMIIA